MGKCMEMHGLQARVNEWCSWLERRRVDDDENPAQKHMRLDEREREALAWITLRQAIYPVGMKRTNRT